MREVAQESLETVAFDLGMNAVLESLVEQLVSSDVREGSDQELTLKALEVFSSEQVEATVKGEL